MTNDNLVRSQWSVKAQFEALIPKITALLRMMFRCVRCVCTKADCVAEGLALFWKWFQRAVALGKDPAAFVMGMATFAARKVRSGGTVCGQQPAKDVMSLTARIKHGVIVEQMSANHARQQSDCQPERGRTRRNDFNEALAENMVTPVPDQVVFRIDWPQFLSKLPERDRKMVEFLARGHSNREAADAFGISRSRVSQLRRGWCTQWQALCA